MKKNLAKGKADRHANKETVKIGHRRDQMREIQNKTTRQPKHKKMPSCGFEPQTTASRSSHKAMR
jgi:hypothetical protein